MKQPVTGERISLSSPIPEDMAVLSPILADAARKETEK